MAIGVANQVAKEAPAGAGGRLGLGLLIFGKTTHPSIVDITIGQQISSSSCLRGGGISNKIWRMGEISQL
jgi:hypothetical protein